MTRPRGVIYWDASAVLSALFPDAHSAQASAALRQPAAHLLSSLAWSEVQAVISRLVREAALSFEAAETARNGLAGAPWRRVAAVPDWDAVSRLAVRWPLRGAALWHLALTHTLGAALPEIRLLTFDEQLHAAAVGEGLAPPADATPTP